MTSSIGRMSTARGRLGSRRSSPRFSSTLSWWATEDGDFSPAAWPISRTLGGYPRRSTESRMTCRILCCRIVSTRPTAGSGSGKSTTVVVGLVHRAVDRDSASAPSAVPSVGSGLGLAVALCGR